MVAGWLREKVGRGVGAGTLGMRRAAQVCKEKGQKGYGSKG